MDHQFCPGSKTLRQPVPEIYTCPQCGDEIEIWSDEFKGVCLKCGKVLFRDANLGCLEWCEYAKECIGDMSYNNIMRNKAQMGKERLFIELENHIDENSKGMKRARDVLQKVEKILTDSNGDWHLVVPAAILHSVGIDVEPKIILKQAGYKPEHSKQICDLIIRLNDRVAEDENSKVIREAEALI